MVFELLAFVADLAFELLVLPTFALAVVVDLALVADLTLVADLALVADLVFVFETDFDFALTGLG